METWDALTARRNVRAYTDEPIPAEHLDRILEAARRAPSSRNTQPWDFVVVTEREGLRRLAEVWQGAGHVAHSAATIALVAPARESEGERVQYDLGQVTAHIMLTATDLGIGSGHSAVGDQALARELLGLPEDRVCAYLIALGYPADRPLRPIRNPNRRAFDDVVHRERW
ncbi:nitroreductase family protein [Amycolatopsis sp.]|uniref:nitroreductase family protein n=1 Tax=Amycolatopsis sp. TaxID=37632 RepID=UPI002B622EB1|nr:nitroreductase family protein [Amycolatopsis sp.]HVV11754.1 nitroreductase family protein [Amycolatopsis sp.]